MTGRLGYMAQQGHLQSAVATVAYYATPPKEEPFLMSQDYFPCQEWYGSDAIIGTAVLEHQPIDVIDTFIAESDYTSTKWAPKNDNDAFQPQQYAQLSQSAPLSSPMYWPSPACSTPATVAAWQPLLESQHRNSLVLSSIATKEAKKGSQRPRHMAGDEGETSDKPRKPVRKKAISKKVWTSAKRCCEKAKRYEINLVMMMMMMIIFNARQVQSVWHKAPA
ncbi:uncharacterized protein LY79DRAFT_572166 [Colletotrichum navitas]|uniref:Uncharacterized protein n=1 Tax=Colletotrichum navitas TaxID=681940 RepID=A0AAD8PKC4_9PEZI|nr:uncharacterized protein LY79DRAFT_572166 [Colletotrichum navitas]KAK1566383.1 hypothetical protein LY79DRAFT_572166 [Colletotrichum navitas]